MQLAAFRVRYVLPLLALLSVLVVHRAAAQGVSPQCIGCGGGGLVITPDGGSQSNPANSSGQTAVFTASNQSGAVMNGVSFSCTASGPLTCTNVSPASYSFDASEDIQVTVTFSTGAIGSGTITLTGSGGGSDVGDYTINVTGPPPPPSAPVVVLWNANEDNIDKGLCLTSGSGEAGAWQCGDLLVSHATPSYTTLGRERSLTLVYSSSLASPHPVAAAAVTQVAGTPPTSVYAELKVDKGAGYVVVASATYGAWTSGTRQISLSFDAGTMFTGWYPYTLEVRNQAASGSTSTVVNGHFLISHEPNDYPYFGRGWSLAGVERITGQLDNSMIWVGPDGSVKHYTLVPPNSWGLWVGPPGAYRDTLSWDGTNYVRKLKHGVVV